jgi:hypothetical protein
MEEASKVTGSYRKWRSYNIQHISYKRNIISSYFSYGCRTKTGNSGPATQPLHIGRQCNNIKMTGNCTCKHGNEDPKTSAALRAMPIVMLSISYSPFVSKEKDTKVFKASIHFVAYNFSKYSDLKKAPLENKQILFQLNFFAYLLDQHIPGKKLFTKSLML